MSAAYPDDEQLIKDAMLASELLMSPTPEEGAALRRRVEFLERRLRHILSMIDPQDMSNTSTLNLVRHEVEKALGIALKRDEK